MDWKEHPYALAAGGAVSLVDQTDHGCPAFSVAAQVLEQNRSFVARHKLGGPEFEIWLLPSSLKVNARAFDLGAVGAVFIHGGLLTRLWDALARAVAGSVFLASRFSWKQPGPDANIPGGPWVVANDKRSAYFLEAFGRAVEFVIFHEVAHLRRRHVRRYRDASGHDFIDEAFGMASEAVVGSKLLQLLEFDADATALEMCLNATSWFRAERGEGSSALDPDHLTSELFLRLLAGTVTFLALDLEAEQSAVSYLGQHPPSIHRAMRYSLLLGDTIRSLSVESDIEPFVDQAWTELSFLARRLGVDGGRWHHRQDELLAFEKLNGIADEANALSRAIDREMSFKE